MSSIDAEAQKLAPSAIISLFTLDATSVGGPVMRFVMSSNAGGKVYFNGLDYTPFDVKFEGLETTGVGPLPQPTLTVSNTNSIIQALVNAYGDANGCVVTRIRTFARFLDGMPDADPNSYIGPDIYAIDRKSEDEPDHVTWELSAAVDQQGKMIPGRIFVAGTCMWRYRVWNPITSSFDMSKAKCPYTGAQSYDINDQPVASGALDVPSRGPSCCKTRFGANEPLAYGGFLGAGDIT